MLRFIFYGLVGLFFFSPSAWGCSCVGLPSGHMSEILEKHTLIYGMPTKTEWFGGHEYTPLIRRDNTQINIGRTTLVDAYVIGNSFLPELTFTHPTTPGSCMMSPILGSKGWFLLAKDSFGAYSSDGCLYRSLHGAILDYYHNGSDPFVTRSIQCTRSSSKERIPRENWSESVDDESKCDFWQRDYSSIFQELQQVYILKDQSRYFAKEKTEP